VAPTLQRTSLSRRHHRKSEAPAAVDLGLTQLVLAPFRSALPPQRRVQRRLWSSPLVNLLSQEVQGALKDVVEAVGGHGETISRLWIRSTLRSDGKPLPERRARVAGSTSRQTTGLQPQRDLEKADLCARSAVWKSAFPVTKPRQPRHALQEAPLNLANPFTRKARSSPTARGFSP